MSDTCFSGSALVLLGTVGGVVVATISALFWQVVKSMTDSTQNARLAFEKCIQDAKTERDAERVERDRLMENLERVTRVGEKTVEGLRAPRRRA